MKNFAVLALLASYAVAQDVREAKEPDMSQFPKDWLQCKDSRSCEKSGDEVSKYDENMRKESM